MGVVLEPVILAFGALLALSPTQLRFFKFKAGRGPI